MQSNDFVTTDSLHTGCTEQATLASCFKSDSLYAFSAPRMVLCMEFLNPEEGLPLSEKTGAHLCCQIQQTSDIYELAKS